MLNRLSVTIRRRRHFVDCASNDAKQWAAWGFARHANFMRPAGVAAAVCAVVGLPRGVHTTVIELQPEAPIAPPAHEQGGQ